MRRAALALLAALALSACTDDPAPQPRADDSPSGAPVSPSVSATPELPAQALVDELLAPDVQPEPLAQVTGTITVGTEQVPVAVDVLEVRAGDASTQLRWRLRSPGAETVSTFGSSMSRAGLQDTRGLVVKDAQTTLQPYTYLPPEGTAFSGAGDLFCACSTLPRSVGPEGVVLYAVLPPLSPGTTTVDVQLPGIAPAPGVPVTR